MNNKDFVKASWSDEENDICQNVQNIATIRYVPENMIDIAANVAHVRLCCSRYYSRDGHLQD